MIEIEIECQALGDMIMAHYLSHQRPETENINFKRHRDTVLPPCAAVFLLFSKELRMRDACEPALACRNPSNIVKRSSPVICAL
jgi:hypothetical protein